MHSQRAEDNKLMTALCYCVSSWDQLSMAGEAMREPEHKYVLALFGLEHAHGLRIEDGSLYIAACDRGELSMTSKWMLPTQI